MRIPAEQIRTAKGGNAGALAAVLAEAMPIAARMLARMRRSRKDFPRIDWEGVQQDVMLGVIQSLPRFRGEDGGQFVAWLHRIVLARVQDALRMRGTGASGGGPIRSLDAIAEVLDVPASDPSPLDHALVAERRAIVSRVIEDLPEQQRLAVRLRCLEGCAYRDVTRQLGLSSENAAECLVRRALQSVRERLREFEPGGRAKNSEIE